MQLVHIINLNKIKFVAKINYQKLGDLEREKKEFKSSVVIILWKSSIITMSIQCLNPLSLLLVLLLCLMCMI